MTATVSCRAAQKHRTEQDARSDQSASRAFRPHAYPGYILIAPDGKIVERVGSRGFQDMKKYLLGI